MGGDTFYEAETRKGDWNATYSASRSQCTVQDEVDRSGGGIMRCQPISLNLVCLISFRLKNGHVSFRLKSKNNVWTL